MKLSSVVLFVLGSALAAHALLIPENVRALSLPEFAPIEQRDVLYAELERRKGGGGGGGKGGGGGSSGSKGGSSGSSGSGSESSGSSGSSGSSSSNHGGTSGSSSATGVRPAYGSGGRYYGGGATTPYTAGLRSPGGLVATTLLSIAALSIFEGTWFYPAYLYPYPESYTFYNASAGQNQTKPVDCLCEEYQECGCDDNTDPTYMSSLLGNGSISALNSTLVQVNDVNGTSTILINGTLPNGTLASDTSANGTTATGGSTSAAMRVGNKRLGIFGWSLIASAIACYLVVL